MLLCLIGDVPLNLSKPRTKTDKVCNQKTDRGTLPVQRRPENKTKGINRYCLTSSLLNEREIGFYIHFDALFV